MRIGEHRDDLTLRVRLLSIATMSALGVLAISFWFIQGVRGKYYTELAENNRLRDVPIRAPRGLIYDRRDRLLVENLPSYNLLLDRSRAANLPVALQFASGVLARPIPDLERVLERYRATPLYTPVLLAEGLTLAQVSRFGIAALDFPAFEIEVGHQRLYRQADHLAHVLGYLGEVGADDLASGKYRPGDLVGKKGVEQRYDETLRGTDGRRVVVVDSRGRPLEEHEQRGAESGGTLRLTLDVALQQAAERALGEHVGAAVALDARNGEILALVSTPAYDPNSFARRLSPEVWGGLLADTRHPLQNRTIQNTYSPGSVFKTVVAMAAMSAGVSPETRHFCSGQTTIYNHSFRCHKRGGHGSVNMHAALRESCDVWFYHEGSKLGVDAIARTARLFGLGTATGIDLQGEKTGLVPDEKWSLATRKHVWYPGETVSVSIGQGPLLVTPVQMAVWMAAIANGGYRVTPHLVRDGSIPPAQRIAGIDPAALALVRRGLWAVVNEQGTGAVVRLPGVEIAGKTSTVQVISQRTWTDNASLPYEQRDHGWFASFGPAGAGETPEVVIVVFVEHGGGGSRTAAPVAKAMYETYFREQLDHPRPL